MKIEIDLMTNGIGYLPQMIAVNKYIEKYKQDSLIPETRKGTGYRIETPNGNFHVSCRKTKGGIYKFNVWRAI